MTLAVTVPERSWAMGATPSTATSLTSAGPTATAGPRAAPGSGPWVEALAHAGAAVDPAAALAATRLARLRDQELGRG